MKLFPAILISYVVSVVAMRIGSADAAWTNAQLFVLNGGAALLAAMIIGYTVVCGIRRFPHATRISIFASIAVIAAVGYGQRADISMKIVEVLAPSVPTAAVASPAGTADVKRHWDGHFRAAASVNGSSIDMLVDTGASLVLLTYTDAIKAGVDMDTLEFDVPILTANGRSHVATLTLDEINIGGVIVESVEAAVAENGQLHASLLGMSFIGEIEEAVIRKDRLILKN